MIPINDSDNFLTEARTEKPEWAEIEAQLTRARLMNDFYIFIQTATLEQIRDILLYVGVQCGDRSRQGDLDAQQRAACYAANCCIRAARDILDWQIAPLEPRSPSEASIGQ